MTEIDADEFPQYATYFANTDSSSGTTSSTNELKIITNASGTCAKFGGYIKVSVQDSDSHKGGGVIFALRTDFKIPNWKGVTSNITCAGTIVPRTTATRFVINRNWCGIGIGKTGTVCFYVFVSYTGGTNQAQDWDVEWDPSLRLLYSPNGKLIVY